MTDSKKALRYIAHGVYLQIFMGVSAVVTVLVVDDASIWFGEGGACGYMLIGLGLNSLIYINRYKRSLGSSEKP